MLRTRKPRTSSSRGQINIREIRNGILELPDREFRIVLEVTAINFELMSEEEQDVLLDTYESFLNSLNTSIQILVRTREIDIDHYLASIAPVQPEASRVVVQQREAYVDFIRSLVIDNKILSRKFYLILAHHPERGVDFTATQEQLSLQAALITKSLARLGMSAKILDSLSVIDLFYSFYNPTRAKVQPLHDHANQLMHTMIQSEGSI